MPRKPSGVEIRIKGNKTMWGKKRPTLHFCWVQSKHNNQMRVYSSPLWFWQMIKSRDHILTAKGHHWKFRETCGKGGQYSTAILIPISNINLFTTCDLITDQSDRSLYSFHTTQPQYQFPHCHYILVIL